MSRKLLLLLLFCFILTGCRANTSENITYSYTSQIFDYADGSLSFSRAMDYLNTPYADFYFSSGTIDSDRISCVESTLQILKELNLSNIQPSICILDIDSPYISGNTLYTGIQEWHSIEFTTMVLLTVSGQCSHYGLSYGYASILCDRFGWSSCHMASFTPTDSIEIYDLNYLCFDNRFASDTNIAVVESNSKHFVITYIEEYGEDTFIQMLVNSDTSAGMNIVASALDSYYLSNGQFVETTKLRYGFGGISNDYIISSDFAIFYICKDWTDQSIQYHSGIPADFLHTQYGDIRDFFETNTCQMIQYQELFALDSYNNALAIIFTNSTVHGNVSMYYLNDHTIYLQSIMDLTHEYIHSLTIPSATHSLEEWEKEGFATFFSVLYDQYSRDFLNNDYNSSSLLAPLRTKLGRPLDVASDNDEILNYIAYCKSYTDPNTNYSAGASFVSFLVYKYGVENVVQHIYGNSDKFSESYASLVIDWRKHVNSMYKN